MNQQQSSTTPPNLRDEWQTPQWLFDWADERFNFEVDLAASHKNRKKHIYIPMKDNALIQSWADRFMSGWCNCPYSETGKWLKKAWDEAQRGFISVFLVNTPNGEKYWQDYVFGKAGEIIFINGRVAFELPQPDGSVKSQPGNTRGSCFVVFNRRYEG